MKEPNKIKPRPNIHIKPYPPKKLDQPFRQAGLTKSHQTILNQNKTYLDRTNANNPRPKSKIQTVQEANQIN
jgi:hypothetical protein